MFKATLSYEQPLQVNKKAPGQVLGDHFVQDFFLKPINPTN